MVVRGERERKNNYNGGIRLLKPYDHINCSSYRHVAKKRLNYANKSAFPPLVENWMKVGLNPFSHLKLLVTF
jgi:hypothetical protein